jgi:hypothetical protein
MSDAEQGEMAAMLEEATPETSPLHEAAQARQDAEHQEWEAQVQYQALKQRYRALLERLTHLQRQEQTAPRKEDALRWRAERQALEHDRMTLGAELSAADEARKQANARMIAAQYAHAALCETASRLYRRLKVAAHAARDPELSIKEIVDLEERAEAAFQDLCGLIGYEEADRLKNSSEKPNWFRS